MSIRLLLSLLLLALFACKQDVPADGDQSAPATAITFKNNDNTLRIGVPVEPPSLNPVLSIAANARAARELIFQTLTSQDPQTFRQVPQLATTPDIRPEADGSVSYSYTLDERAKWPNGLPVTAADVIFSLKLLMNPLVPAGAQRSYYTDVRTIVTSPNNERRFRVVMAKPYLLAEKSLGSLTIYPEYFYDPDKRLRNVRLADLTNTRTAERLAETNEDLKAFAEAFNQPELNNDPEKLVGSGPYRLESWEAGQRLTFVKRDDYWAEGTRNEWMMAKPERIVMEIIPDPATMLTALRDEKVDLALGLGVEQFLDNKDDAFLNEHYDFTTVGGLNFFSILLNQNNPLLREVATRRALAHLVDIDAIIEQLLPDGLATRLSGPVLPAKDYYADLPNIDYDPDRAAALLTEAGWGDSNGDGTLDRTVDGTLQELKLDFRVFPSSTSTAIGALVKEWAAEAGVEINVIPQAPRALYEELNKGNFTLALQGLSMAADPDDFTQVWASTSVPPNGSNRSGFADRRADQLIRQIARSTDAGDREPLYREFQQIIYDNQPMVFLFSPATRLVVSKRFAYSPTQLSPGIFFGAMALRE